MEPWIGLVGVILGAVIAGFIGYATSKTQFDRQKEWEKQQLVKTKLENIYELLEEYRQAYVELTGKLVLMAVAGNAIDQFPSLPISKLTMLVNLYAPQLKADLNQIYQLRDEYGALLAKIVKASRTGQANSYLSELRAEHSKIESLLDKMLLETVKLSETLSK